MVEHREIILIPANEYDRVNRLLEIESLEDMTDEELIEEGADTDVCEGVYHIKFDDGSTLNFDLCSGQHNYYDDVVWTSADEKTDVVLDCDFELGDIEVEINSELYIVKIIRV